MLYRKLLSYFVCAIGIFFSCKRDDLHITTTKERTTIIYMVADNDLYYNAETDISEILAATFDTVTSNILIYVDGKDNSLLDVPTIYKVHNGELIKLKDYSFLNSTSPHVLNKVLLDAKALSPSKKYGLVLWSHATGWLPPDLSSNIFKSSNSNKLGLVKSFGRQKKNEMDIIDLANSIPYQMDFILFDACLMSSVECIYELKDKSAIIIASPTDILAYGFPYEDIVPILSKNTIDYADIGKKYMEFYHHKFGLLNSGTITVVKTENCLVLKKLYRGICRDEGLRELSRKRPNIKNLINWHIEDRVIEFALEHLAFRQINTT